MGASAAVIPEPFAVIEIPGDPVPRRSPNFKVIQKKGVHPSKWPVMAYPSKKQKDYLVSARTFVEAALLDVHDAPTAKPVMVGLQAFLSIPQSWPNHKRVCAQLDEVVPGKRPDLDNYLKMALDACNGLVFVDDAQVIDSVQSKRYANRDERAFVRITVWETGGVLP